LNTENDLAIGRATVMRNGVLTLWQQQRGRAR